LKGAGAYLGGVRRMWRCRVEKAMEKGHERNGVEIYIRVE
jgi:hypothetical protein